MIILEPILSFNYNNIMSGKTVITYGTFDTFHWGHLNILKRAYNLSENGKLIVFVSTDEFNSVKNKKSYHSYNERKENVEAIKFVDSVYPETSWDQKPDDIKKFNADLLVMGDDWKDSKEFLKIQNLVETEFLPRTKSISSTDIREILSRYNDNTIN